jgi:anti-sigma B factor antagonist
MHVDITQDGNRIVISLEGDLDFTTRDGFESEVRRILHQAPDIVLDLGRVRFIDSSGVAAILSSCEDASLAGNSVRIRNVAPDLMEIFELIGVHQVLPFE